MTQSRRCFVAMGIVLGLLWGAEVSAASFRVGYASCEITPTKPTPMWGYGDRHNLLSQGVRDPLHARAVVVDVGSQKLAIVGMDLGRGPRSDMMERIRTAVKANSGVGLVMIAGSHTHHGPVIELRDQPGEGQGVFDDTLTYTVELEQKLIGVIAEAAGKAQDARIGWGSTQVDMNRNRQCKREPKPTERELGVLRFDDLEGKPLVLLVNFAAHPTMLPGEDRRFSAEYPGQMIGEIERVSGIPCVFMQGAAGDLSVQTKEHTQGPEGFGRALAQEALAVAKTIETTVPKKPSLQGMDEDFCFETRLDLHNPLTLQLFKVAFFSELAVAYVHNDLVKNQLHPHLTTVLVNGELALVGGSGEFFCEHSNRLKARSQAKKTFFFGYCNGHHMYFPTIEATAEGGYGADPTVSWVALGAGEQMMNKALINLNTLLGKYQFNLLGL